MKQRKKHTNFVLYRSIESGSQKKQKWLWVFKTNLSGLCYQKKSMHLCVCVCCYKKKSMHFMCVCMCFYVFTCVFFWNDVCQIWDKKKSFCFPTRHSNCKEKNPTKTKQQKKKKIKTDFFFLIFVFESVYFWRKTTNIKKTIVS